MMEGIDMTASSLLILCNVTQQEHDELNKILNESELSGFPIPTACETYLDIVCVAFSSISDAIEAKAKLHSLGFLLCTVDGWFIYRVKEVLSIVKFRSKLPKYINALSFVRMDEGEMLQNHENEGKVIIVAVYGEANADELTRILDKEELTVISKLENQRFREFLPGKLRNISSDTEKREMCVSEEERLLLATLLTTKMTNASGTSRPNINGRVYNKETLLKNRQFPTGVNKFQESGFLRIVERRSSGSSKKRKGSRVSSAYPVSTDIKWPIEMPLAQSIPSVPGFPLYADNYKEQNQSFLSRQRYFSVPTAEELAEVIAEALEGAKRRREKGSTNLDPAAPEFKPQSFMTDIKVSPDLSALSPDALSMMRLMTERKIIEMCHEICDNEPEYVNRAIRLEAIIPFYCKKYKEVLVPESLSYRNLSNLISCLSPYIILDEEKGGVPSLSSELIEIRRSLNLPVVAYGFNDAVRVARCICEPGNRRDYFRRIFVGYVMSLLLPKSQQVTRPVLPKVGQELCFIAGSISVNELINKWQYNINNVLPLDELLNLCRVDSIVKIVNNSPELSLSDDSKTVSIKEHIISENDLHVEIRNSFNMFSCSRELPYLPRRVPRRRSMEDFYPAKKAPLYLVHRPPSFLPDMHTRPIQDDLFTARSAIQYSRGETDSPRENSGNFPCAKVSSSYTRYSSMVTEQTYRNLSGLGKEKPIKALTSTKESPLMSMIKDKNVMMAKAKGETSKKSSERTMCTAEELVQKLTIPKKNTYYWRKEKNVQRGQPLDQLLRILKQGGESKNDRPDPGSPSESRVSSSQSSVNFSHLTSPPQEKGTFLAENLEFESILFSHTLAKDSLSSSNLYSNDEKFRNQNSDILTDRFDKRW